MNFVHQNDISVDKHHEFIPFVHENHCLVDKYSKFASGAPYKTQSSNTDADWIRIDLPQGQEAGVKSRAGGEHIVNKDYVQRDLFHSDSFKGPLYIPALLFDVKSGLCLGPAASEKDVRTHLGTKFHCQGLGYAFSLIIST